MERFVLVIGAGQAGLAAGHHLSQADMPFVIVDAARHVGDSWRARYDGLTLFTPRQFSALPGMNLPGNREGYPDRDEFADYLESYAERFRLPVRLETRVDRLVAMDDGFEAALSNGETLHASEVIVATDLTEGDGVTRMIGDSEDPAHMRFLPDEARNRGWKVTSAIGHFKRAGERFADALSSSPDDVDKDMMSARFSLPGSDRASKVPAGVQDDTSEAEGAVALEEREGSSDVLKFRHNPKANTLTGRLSPAAREAVEAGPLTDIEVTGEYVGSLKGAGSFGNQDSRFSVDGCLDFATDGATVSISGVTQDLKVVFKDIDPNRDFKVVAKIIDPQLEYAA